MLQTNYDGQHLSYKRSLVVHLCRVPAAGLTVVTLPACGVPDPCPDACLSNRRYMATSLRLGTPEGAAEAATILSLSKEDESL